MSMQSWGYSELLLDLNKAKKAAPLEWIIMRDLIEEEELSPHEIASMEVSPKLKKAIEEFIDKILYELEVEIYPQYISSEAEGLDEYAGTLVWCVVPEYQPQVNNATSEHITWSEFG